MRDGSKLNVVILEHTPNPERVVTTGARLCYSPSNIDDLAGKFTDEENEKFLKRFLGFGHDSPLEHINFTFLVEGVSRSLTHQLVRHRIASYSQQSQRYVPETQFEYIVPKPIRDNPIAHKTYVEFMEESQRAYDKITTELLNEYMINDLVERHTRAYFSRMGLRGRNYGGIKKSYIEQFGMKDLKALHKKAIEDARYVFPNGIETKIMFTMNVRTLLNFFELRCCRRASAEIRELADEMLRQVLQVAPVLFSKAGASCMYGKCREGAMTCGEPRTPDEYKTETPTFMLDEVGSKKYGGKDMWTNVSSDDEMTVMYEDERGN